MRTSRSKLFALAAGGVGVCALILMFALPSASQPIRLTVRKFTTDNCGLRAPQIGSQPVYAIIEVTNAGSRPITYYSYHPFIPWRPQAAHNLLLYRGLFGWAPRPVFREACQNALTLDPSESTTFVAQIDSDRPCRVALDFSDDHTRAASRMWQRLPRWLTQRLPWANGRVTVTTETIDWPCISKERQKS